MISESVLRMFYGIGSWQQWKYHVNNVGYIGKISVTLIIPVTEL